MKHVRCEFPRGKCGAERDRTCPVRSEQIRGQASEDPHPRVARDDPAGSARSDDLAPRACCGIAPGGPAHLQGLHGPAFGPLAFGMPGLTEADLERHFLVSVIVHIETERVQTLLVEGIRRLGSCVRVYRHRHDGGTRLAAEKIEVKEVEPRVFPGDGAPIAPARFYSFTDAEANTKEQIQKARSHPWISPEVPVRGFVYDVSTGRLSEVSPDR